MADIVGTNQTGREPVRAMSAPTPLRPAHRRWLYRILAMTVIPALCLFLLEITLRLCGYGYPPGFFLPRSGVGQEGFTENREFGRRFFPPGLARGVHPMVLPAEKPDGTYRIFILGESAAMGFPDASFSFSRILAAMLRQRYPQVRFEIVNTAMSAINSHVILPIARDCAAQRPDLFIVYMGNNEVVGPFGASGVLGPFTTNLSLIRASIAAKATRIGQLLDDLMRHAARSEPPARTWGGMAMFTAGQVRFSDARLPAIYSHFESNLGDICALSRDAGAKVVVCTVASNLRDCAPFASLPAADLPADKAVQWQKLVDDGAELETVGKHALAIEHFQSALAIDAEPADLHFRLGRCFTALKNSTEACRHFVLARDRDALRFRADSGINQAIRHVAQARQDEGIYLVDVEKAMSAASAGGSPGEDFFYEHVHGNFAGNYLLARTIFTQMTDILPDWILDHADSASTSLPEQECEQRLPFTDWNRYKALSMIVHMGKLAPFTGQLDHAERLKGWQRRSAELEAKLGKGGMQEALAAYQRVLERGQADFCMHKDYALLLWEQNRHAEAIQQIRAALAQIPHDYVQLSRLAELMAIKGDFVQAFDLIDKSLRLAPDDPQMHSLLGRLCLAKREPDRAVAAFKRALELYPDNPDIHTNLGQALAMQQHPDLAEAEFNKALKLEPRFLNAHLLLGQLLAKTGRFEAALGNFEAAVRISPNNIQSHSELAFVLTNLGRLDEAIAQVEETLRLKSDWPEMKLKLEELRRKKMMR